MIRFLAYTLVAVFLISIVRMFIGLIGKGLSEFFGTSSPPAQPGPRPPSSPASGELKQDPVCGTYVSTATTFRKSVAGQTVYFCSAACRDKHAG